MIVMRRQQFNILNTSYKLFSSFFKDLNLETNNNKNNNNRVKPIDNKFKSNSNLYKRSIFKSQKSTDQPDLSARSIMINKNYLVKSFTRFRFDKRDLFRLFDFNYF